MIQFTSILGLIVSIDCLNLSHLTEYPVGNKYSDYPSQKVCKVVSGHYSSTFLGSCNSILKLCNIKVRK